MVLQPLAAAWFLLIAVPVGLFVTYSDLSRMKIPNLAVGALFLGYIVIGLFVLPFETYLWGLLHVVVAMVLGIMFNAAGAIGAGDAKFIAVAAAFVPLGDIVIVITIFAMSLLGAFFAHRIVRATPLRAQVPHWESWNAGNRFPMGFPLAMTLVGYLVIAALQG